MTAKIQQSTVAFAVLAVTSGAVQAITLEDYIDPNSKYEDAYVNGSFRIANEAANATNTTGTNAPLVGNSLDLNLNVDFSRVDSTLKRVKTLEASAGGSLKKDDNGTLDNIGANLSASYDKYFDEAPNAFWYGSSTLGYEPNREEELAVDATVGVGVGRVINATSLAKALRLVEELQNNRLLNSYPNDAVMLAIAQLINKELEFRSDLGEDDYRTGWYQAIEGTLDGAGVLADGGLGALGVIKIDEVLSAESISTRKHGWVARVGATAILQDHDGNDAKPAFSIGFEYAKPYGYRGQLINDATYLVGENSTLRNKLSYSYEVSNSVDWETFWDMRLEQFKEEDSKVSNRISSGFSYELSNLLSLNTGLIVVDSEGADTSAEIVTSVRYRLK